MDLTEETPIDGRGQEVAGEPTPAKNYSTLSDAIEAKGLGIVEAIADGEIHRFETPDDKPGQESGWYIDFGTGGAFGDWRTGIKHKWFNGNISKADLKAARAKMKKDQAKREKAREEAQDKAAGSALGMWGNATELSAIGKGNIHIYQLIKNDTAG